MTKLRLVNHFQYISCHIHLVIQDHVQIHVQTHLQLHLLVQLCNHVLLLYHQSNLPLISYLQSLLDLLLILNDVTRSHHHLIYRHQLLDQHQHGLPLNDQLHRQVHFDSRPRLYHIYQIDQTGINLVLSQQLHAKLLSLNHVHLSDLYYRAHCYHQLHNQMLFLEQLATPLHIHLSYNYHQTALHSIV
ncbi:Uncharacterised protein [Streptococcus pneumoniae]|nr:Uncharacterised protein [Streptococcus pneumoniae]COQ71571.1 Uncharacterised protein [Streptococcus pneumoniae]